MLVKCPSVLLVNSAVIPIIHVCSAEFPISFAEENDRTLEAVKQQPGCVVNHLSVFPEVTTHVHILGSLSLGHSPLSSRSLQIKSTLAKAAHMDYKNDKRIPYQDGMHMLTGPRGKNESLKQQPLPDHSKIAGTPKTQSTIIPCSLAEPASVSHNDFALSVCGLAFCFAVRLIT